MRPMRSNNTNNIEIPTFRHGQYQVDYILCSNHLAPHITHSSIQEFGEICSSDHRSLLLDIKLNDYIQQSINLPNAHIERLITPKKPKHISLYKNEIIQQLTTDTTQDLIHHLTNHLHNNTLTPQDHVKLYELDHIFTSIRLQAENHLKIKTKDKQ